MAGDGPTWAWGFISLPAKAALGAIEVAGAAGRLGAELRVERHHAIDLSGGDAGDMADVMNSLFRDVPVGVLRRLQEGNQRPEFAFIFPEVNLESEHIVG